MGEMAEDFRDLREASRARRGMLEPERMAYARERLIAVGCTVEDGPDGASLDVEKAGKRWRFWPYTGWFNGPGGNKRGISHLLDAIAKVSQ
jgi:hypothetical protein